MSERQPGHDAGSGQRYEFHLGGDAGFETYGGAGGDVQPLKDLHESVDVSEPVIDYFDHRFPPSSSPRSRIPVAPHS